MKGVRGFTLVELMVVLAIAGVLLALSVPFGRYINNTANIAHLHEFAATLNFARNTAITSGAQAVICQLNVNKTECIRSNNGCSSNNANNVGWHTGWAIFIDRNNDCTIRNEVSDTTDDDPILRIHDPLPPNYTLIGGKGEFIVFSHLGMSSTSNDTWTLCDPTNDTTLAKAVIMSQTGRIRFAEDSDDDGIPDVGTGADKKQLTCLGTDYKEEG
jgi:type IV fimbrial biogenesis protein FimT